MATITSNIVYSIHQQDQKKKKRKREQHNWDMGKARKLQPINKKKIKK